MNRPRLVLDTNVLISAILFGGKPRLILEQIISGALEGFISPEILEEVEGVLTRSKFGFTLNEAFQVKEELQSTFKLVFPQHPVHIIVKDPADNRILESALAAKADFIISGDRDLIELRDYKKIKILTPAQFLETYSISETLS